jgi:hypothetical protein
VVSRQTKHTATTFISFHHVRNVRLVLDISVESEYRAVHNRLGVREELHGTIRRRHSHRIDHGALAMRDRMRVHGEVRVGRFIVDVNELTRSKELHDKSESGNHSNVDNS